MDDVFFRKVSFERGIDPSSSYRVVSQAEHMMHKTGRRESRQCPVNTITQ